MDGRRRKESASTSNRSQFFFNHFPVLQPNIRQYFLISRTSKATANSSPSPYIFLVLGKKKIPLDIFSNTDHKSFQATMNLGTLCFKLWTRGLELWTQNLRTGESRSGNCGAEVWDPRFGTDDPRPRFGTDDPRFGNCGAEV